jgi:hypothetical protein
MRIQSRTTLKEADVYAAARYARSKGHDIDVASIITAPRGGITFYCSSMYGKRAANGRPGERAASWTAWGWLIADLLKRDPNAIVGQYKGVEDFKRQCREYMPKGENVEFLRHLPRSYERTGV